MSQRVVGGIVAAAAIALLVSLFLEWYRPGVSGWTAFEALDLFFAFAAAYAFGCGVAALAAGEWPRWARVLWIVAVAIVVATVVEMVDPPQGSDAIPHDADLAVGTWLALGSSLVLVVGGLLARRHLEVGESVGRVRTERGF